MGRRRTGGGVVTGASQRAFVLQVSGELAEAMAREGMTQVTVAKRAGVTQPRVSQVLQGGKNVTLMTVAAMAMAMGYEPKVELRRVAKTPGGDA